MVHRSAHTQRVYPRAVRSRRWPGSPAARADIGRDRSKFPAAFHWRLDKGLCRMRQIIVGIAGASGTIYGIRLLEVLRTITDVETHLVLSRTARMNIGIETGYAVAQVEALADRVHKTGDVTSTLSSGSFHTGGMNVGKRGAE